MKKTILFISMLAVVISCSETENEKMGRLRFHETYITDYVIPDKILIQSDKGQSLHFTVASEGETYSYPSESFREYAKLYGDTAFNGYYPEPNIIGYVNLYPNDIICDKDIDEEHIAGSSLKDLFDIRFEPLHNLISNGYVDAPLKIFISGKMKDITIDDCKLVTAFDISLDSLTASKLSGDYKFTISCITDGNKELKENITVSF